MKMINLGKEAKRINGELQSLRQEEACQRTELTNLCKAFNPAVAGQFAAIVNRTVNFGIEKEELASLFGCNAAHIDTIRAGLHTPSPEDQKVYVGYMLKLAGMQQNFR
jgi:hypothetical protein